MSRYVALLRGVNVGGKNILPMKHLASFFADAGCKNVATFIQSGNVVFDGSAKVSTAVCSRIKADFGLDTTLVLRSLPEMEKIAKANPFPETDQTHVVFLAAEPLAEQIAQLDPNRSAPDQFKVLGREIYLYMPNGMGRTKLTNAYFDSKLNTVTTMRNW